MPPDLGPNAFQRAFQRFATIRPVSWVFRHTAHHLDRIAAKRFGGRTLSGMLAGIPNIMLTTTGARTGRLRTVPLVGLRVDGGLAVVGTRFGSDQHPGWYHNLIRHPEAFVEVRGSRAAVTARQVPPGDEYDRIMAVADSVYRGYVSYRQRITDRLIPVFVLEPRPDTSSDGSGQAPVV